MSRDTIDPTAQRQLERERTAEQAKASARAAHPAGKGDMDRPYTLAVNDLLDLVMEVDPDNPETTTTAEDYANLQVMADKIATKAGIDLRFASMDEG